MTSVVDTHRAMTALDRCDKCGAQAMVRATLVSGELYFCGHHGREMGTPLVQKALQVFDPEGVFNYAHR